MSKILTADDFEPLVGKHFSVVGLPEILELVSVERHRASGVGGRAPFTVFLQGPRSRQLREGLYQITAAECPVFELYIIPIITPPGDRQDYQCVFN